MKIMQEHGSKLVILALLALVVGVPFAIQPASSTSAGPTQGKLTIYTPHNEQIRHELGQGFNRHRLAQGKAAITFDWRASGGTSDLRRQVLSQFSQMVRKGQAEAGVGADLFFGGGEYEHHKLAQGVRITQGDKKINLSASIPIDLDPALLAQALPEATIGGERTYHPDRYWIGTALSSFGIVYNRNVLTMLGLPEPTTWRDLADGRYLRWIALTDPGKSGSIAATYQTILQREGWQEGWRVLRRAFANARYFTSSASKVPVDVSAGEAAAGMCIDFYGRFQSGAIGGDRVGYVDPPGMTAVTADPISLLRGAPHQALSLEFIAWLMTKESQQLWQKRVGTEGGPTDFELRRQPIRPDVYTHANRSTWSDPQIDPYAQATPLPKGIPNFFSLVAPVTHAMAIDIHDDLVAAWEAILATPDSDPRKAKMLALFDAMPEALQIPWPDDEMATHWRAYLADPQHPRHAQAAQTLKQFTQGFRQRYRADPDAAIADRLAWTLFFRDHYRQIVTLGR